MGMRRCTCRRKVAGEAGNSVVRESTGPVSCYPWNVGALEGILQHSVKALGRSDCARIASGDVNAGPTRLDQDIWSPVTMLLKADRHVLGHFTPRLYS